MCDRDSERERVGVGGRGNELANRANRAEATDREQLVWNRGLVRAESMEGSEGSIKGKIQRRSG